MTDLNDFYHKPCEKLSAACVDAFVELVDDPTNPANLGVSSSWGTNYIDMGPIVKASETVTHLTLTESALQYDNESGETDCINGDDLSSIISMHLLKDVNKTVTLEAGMAYVWDGTQFTPQTINAATDTSSLEAKVAQLETSVSLLQTSNTKLTQEVADLINRVTALENKSEANGGGTTGPDVESCYRDLSTGTIWSVSIKPTETVTGLGAVKYITDMSLSDQIGKTVRITYDTFKDWVEVECDALPSVPEPTNTATSNGPSEG